MVKRRRPKEAREKTVASLEPTNTLLHEYRLLKIILYYLKLKGKIVRIRTNQKRRQATLQITA